ncbi:DUF4177 domain-containing protein [Stenotrophomonas sp. 169]|jgi:hypothetical protein|uniref:DUF4177 domain-containing protein n=1 Tax=unclassified Stenotrophomonas TaxID=196198 RepID=UPI0016624001|nr:MULTISPECIES: DUF4177 domain-containing protein [unclassified Stenotrophomonas]MBD8636320.1 DUF4177 domain-containing protein [Stenotrophomonas sp. CFBP 13725]MBD8696712.1 DUF4177 domain-containing protein [Stenotrophomonas sp. CFBP 13718]QNR98319.1 DUF4177 domain-containing protein [Stenotrophomonas sp. 169]
MSKRWTYQTIEIKPGLMGGFKVDEVQTELNRQGQLGWELVNIVFAPLNPMILVFKKEA